jgi:putative transposase
MQTTVGIPQCIAVDFGPEFVSEVLDAWAHRNGVHLEFSRPGRTTDNAFMLSISTAAGSRRWKRRGTRS